MGFAEEQANMFFDCYDYQLKQMDCLEGNTLQKTVLKRMHKYAFLLYFQKLDKNKTNVSQLHMSTQPGAEDWNQGGSVKKWGKPPSSTS